MAISNESTLREHGGRVLIADDQADVRHALRLLLKGEGFDTAEVSSPAGILSAIGERDFDVLLMDLNYARDTTSGQEGIELLQRIRTLQPTLPVVVMTAWSSIENAVEAIRSGARDYVEKPWDNTRLLATLDNQVELARALRKSQRLESAELRGRQDLPDFTTESRAMRPVLEMVERVAPSDAHVLIAGEHGSGKEVVARWIHAASERAARPLVTLNSGGLSEGLLESELFGHVKGAFTDAKTDRVGCFELAHEGTLFLDEIGTMPMSQQAKLLRVLQTGEFQRVGSSRTQEADVRVLSATNVDLYAEAKAGRMREDLLYRINTVEIQIPPLRERREDIPLLAAKFLRESVQRYRKDLDGFRPDAMEALLAHPWPGNVRELEHTVERAVLMAQGDALQLPDLGLRTQTGDAPDLFSMPLEDAERAIVSRALERAGGNVSQAANALGVSRSALYRRLQRHGS